LTINAVTNDAWSQYQGSGTINNKTPTTSGDVYKFYVASEDGSWNGGTTANKFRMKIWEQNSSGQVVNVIYDNQSGASDIAGEPPTSTNGDLTSTLTGGNITLHKLNGAQATSVGNNPTAQPLTEQQLAPVVQQAIAAWSAAGISAEQLNVLRQTAVYITDLPGAFVGMSSPDGIWLDKDAAGNGWFIDATQSAAPFSDSLAGNKFAALPGSLAYGEMDLLTIIEHEMGRPLGLQETPDAPGVMAMKFQPGVRELPTASDFSATGAPVQVSQAKSDSPASSFPRGAGLSDTPFVDHATAVDLNISDPPAGTPLLTGVGSQADISDVSFISTSGTGTAQPTRWGLNVASGAVASVANDIPDGGLTGGNTSFVAAPGMSGLPDALQPAIRPGGVTNADFSTLALTRRAGAFAAHEDLFQQLGTGMPGDSAKPGNTSGAGEHGADSRSADMHTAREALMAEWNRSKKDAPQPLPSRTMADNPADLCLTFMQSDHLIADAVFALWAGAAIGAPPAKEKQQAAWLAKARP
jgi:hypothetical protein